MDGLLLVVQVATLLLLVPIYKTLKGLRRQMDTVDEKMVALEALVTTDIGIDRSAQTAIEGLSQMLKDALAQGGNAAAITARIQAVIDAMDASNATLAQAIAANPVPSSPSLFV